MTLVTKKFNVKTASQEDLIAINEFGKQIQKEQIPEDPSRPLESTIKNLQSLNLLSDMELSLWYVWQGQEIVASLVTEVGFFETNRHLMNIDLSVLATHRRQGIASELLVIALEVAKKHNRTLILEVTSARVPSGEAFAKRLGASVGLSEHTNQLVLADLDLKLMQSWVKQAKTKAEAFSLEFLDGPIPESKIDEVLDLIHVMNTAPKDDLDIEDFHATAKQMRDFEALSAERGMERWMYFARHKETNELAGYTELFTNPANQELLNQAATGVLPKYRGHAIGRWLKASMVLKVLKEKPDIKFIRTGNADSNAAMLAINEAMGFKPFNAETIWQLETDKLKAYLQEKGLI